MATRTHGQMTEDMAAAAEHVRKTAAAATEQARQTMSEAQEQWHSTLTQSQQAQTDLSEAVAQLSEQNSKLVRAAFGGFWDASLSMLNMASWSQEQIDRSVRQLMDQGRISREEGLALVREAGEQARTQQAELVRLAQEQLAAALQAARAPGATTDTAGGHAKRG
ncbi:MAG: hypothetical protein IT340_17270 [Chloroflexi bacterium]|nr:hypothetical protein [Chloroflexota bacterium]